MTILLKVKTTSKIWDKINLPLHKVRMLFADKAGYEWELFKYWSNRFSIFRKILRGVECFRIRLLVLYTATYTAKTKRELKRPLATNTGWKISNSHNSKQCHRWLRWHYQTPWRHTREFDFKNKESLKCYALTASLRT